MVNLNNFWRALRLSWLRQFIGLKSMWAKLHRSETAPYTFNLITSNFDDLTKEKMLCKNSFCKEVYSSLISCRLNILAKYPAEFLTIPINGEPLITKNKRAIMQDWSSSEMINTLLDENCKIKEVDQFISKKRPLNF